MKVSRERLSVIGRMIGIYREERRGNTQNSWTQLKFCEDICSPNTLKNIESGGIARSQELYEKLLEKLDLKLGEFPVIDEAVQDLIDKLYVAIEFFDNAEIDSLTAKGIKILENAKDYVYYSELFTIFVDLRSYYLDDIVIGGKKVEKYMLMVELFKHDLSDLTKLLIFARIKLRCTSDFTEYKYYIEKLDLKNSCNACLKINLLHYYYISKQRFQMINILDELEKEFKEKDNINKLLDVYSFAIVMFSDIDGEKSKDYIEKANTVILNYTLSEAKIAEVNANIATFYYNLKDYRLSLEYLEKAVTCNRPNLLLNCLLIADCQNHIKHKISIPTINKRDLRNYPDDLRVMYQYFYNAQDENVPAFVKQKMLMKHVLPLLCDDVLVDIFRFELNRLVEYTNSYKTLHLFEKAIGEKDPN